MNIIEQLKNNRYQWGMWLDPECYGPELGKAMQEKAREIGYQHFNHYDYRGCWRGHNKLGEFDNLTCFHLRADYAEQPEIEECEIYEDGDHLHFQYCMFEDGTVWATSTYSTSGEPGMGSVRTSLAKIKSGSHTVLHATHVLFRRQK